MDAAHGVAFVEIGEGAGDPEHPVVAARGEAHAFGGFCQQGPALGFGRGHLFQQFPVDFRIAPGGARERAVLAVQPGVAGALALAGGGHPGGHGARILGGRRQGEIRRVHRRHLHMQVDAVEERPGDLGLVVERAARRARAGQGGIVQIAAAAGTRCLVAILRNITENCQTQALSGQSADDRRPPQKAAVRAWPATEGRGGPAWGEHIYNLRVGK